MLEKRTRPACIMLVVFMLLCCSGLLPAGTCTAAADELVFQVSALEMPPVLLADSDINVVNKPVELIFDDDVSWREAISSIYVDGVALDSEKYSIDAGQIIIDKSMFRISKDYNITVTASGYADAIIDQTIGLLCITGDGVRQETVFTRAELEAMQQERAVFSATNDFPMDFPVAAEGIPLQVMLDCAGIKAEAQLLSFRGTDGYWADFTVDELLQQKRYVFPAGTEIEPLVALKRVERSDDFADLDTAYTPVLCLGQRAATEQTVLTFVKLLQTITVTTGPLEQWDAPDAKIIDLASGQKFTITGGEVDRGAQIVLRGDPKTKIYYTTDGSEPDLNSRIYNLHGCGPMAGQDEPIVIDTDTIVKAKGIWPGKLDSETAVFTFTVRDGASSAAAEPEPDPELTAGPAFSDIQYSWAKEDIELLAGRGLITGRSDSLYEPEGKITRAEFAALLVRALGLQEKVLAEGQFADVDPTDWYAGSIAAAAAQDIICGYEGQLFKPDCSITREEMAVMVVRAASIAGKEGELSRGEREEIMIEFQDRDKISSWAENETALAVRAGIIKGTAAGEFAPRLEVDRAQTAAVLMRFLTYADLLGD